MTFFTLYCTGDYSTRVPFPVHRIVSSEIWLRVVLIGCHVSSQLPGDPKRSSPSPAWHGSMQLIRAQLLLPFCTLQCWFIN